MNTDNLIDELNKVLHEINQIEPPGSLIGYYRFGYTDAYDKVAGLAMKGISLITTWKNRSNR